MGSNGNRVILTADLHPRQGLEVLVLLSNPESTLAFAVLDIVTKELSMFPFVNNAGVSAQLWFKEQAYR